MTGKRNFKHSSSKGVTDAIFEGLIGGIIKVLAEWLVKIGGVVIIIAVLYFLLAG